MIVRRGKVLRSGTSHVVVIPGQLQIGKEVTLAASRLMLVDVRGEIPETTLGKLLEDVLEPALFSLRGKKNVEVRP